MIDAIKLRTLLGFASKAGDLVAGTAVVERAIKRRRVYLVICAADLSPKTLKNFEYFCQASGVEFFSHGTRCELGNWIGQPERGIIGITSRQFALAIQGLFTDRGDSQ
jgi:ribosomal protein L7Ae-like RNA K-turn-binding protein